MYTTAEAVRLVVRASTYREVPCYCYIDEHQRALVATLVEIGIFEHHVADLGSDLVKHRLVLTDLGVFVFDQLQRHFEELLHKARTAADERARLQRQRDLPLGGRTNDR